MVRGYNYSMQIWDDETEYSDKRRVVFIAPSTQQQP